MKIKNLMLLALPAIALSVGIAALASSKTVDCSSVSAADYTPSNRKITFNNDGSVTATFSVNDNVLDSRGWLLCLFESKPSFDPVTHKIVGSESMHPYSTNACSHYFFASNSTKEGNISVTWNEDYTDQKENWTTTETPVAEGRTLNDCLSETTDWYIVIGVRHWNNQWGKHGDEHGEGYDGWWENTDYYAGKKSIITGNLPYGEIYLDLTEYPNWKKDDAKFGVYFFDKQHETDQDKKVFTSFATPVPLQDGIYIVSYELNFVPTHMIGVRFDSACTTPNWDDEWNQTQDLTFYRHGVIGVTGDDYGWSDALASVKITRGSEEIEVVLDNYKRNAEKKSEHYNDYIDLKKNDVFTIEYNSESYYGYDCLPIFDDNFSSASQTIKVEVAGTYSFYFKAYGNHDVFISKPEVAFADAWATSFLDENCEATKSNWSSSETEFNKLPHSAKEFLLNVEHEPDPEVQFANYFAQAIQRYDYIIYLYGTSEYKDYIGRVTANKVTPRTANSLNSIFSNDTSASITIVLIVSVISLTTIGGYLVLKRKKAN